MNNPKCKTFEYLIGTTLKSLREFPKEIDVLRMYFDQSSKLSDTRKITKIVQDIEKKYRERGIHIKATESIRLKTKRLVKSCKDLIAKRKICRNSQVERMRQEKFRQNIENVFEVTRMFLIYSFCILRITKNV